ncbi:unnamed protein product [Peronospora belbahrii]|uniref:SHSP domain-containing protein n=1 Tax=Peronospora belbahrii TaxID=622444 RepID=A0AAU9KYM9_9STRA|nr:unnamed protein product [Peronospora belbahrii]CAH0514592.1 unnamed protein product [Peronospora belbahrii]
MWFYIVIHVDDGASYTELNGDYATACLFFCRNFEVEVRLPSHLKETVTVSRPFNKHQLTKCFETIHLTSVVIVAVKKTDHDKS